MITTIKLLLFLLLIIFLLKGDKIS